MLLLVVLGLILAPSGGNAEDKVPYPLSGNALLAQCEKYDSEKRMSTEVALCAGYVQGVTDAVALYDDLLELDTGGAIEALTGRRSCIPAGTTYEQHIRVIVKYLRDHPEKLHMQRFLLALNAVRAAFPCPKAK